MSAAAYKLSAIEVPAVFAGTFYTVAVMPNGKVYLDYHYDDYHESRFAGGCSNNVYYKCLDIDISEIAQIVCDFTIYILKTDGRTVVEWNPIIGTNELIKTETYYTFDVIYINIYIASVSHLFALSADGNIHFDDRTIIKPITEDGDLIKASKVVQQIDDLIIHGEDGYCYYIVDMWNERSTYTCNILLKDGKPIKLSYVGSKTGTMVGMEDDGIIHLWNADQEYSSTITDSNGDPIKMSKICLFNDDIIGITDKGDIHFMVENEYLKDNFPKKEDGERYKIMCADITNGKAVGIIENGDVIIWGDRLRKMKDENGDPLNIFSGRAIKSARKC